MNYKWADGKIKFCTHEKDGEYYFAEVEGSTPIEPPSAEIVAKCEGKTFKNYSEAKAFIEGGCIEPLSIESLAEVVADIIGGAI